jgi:hypothetical protein
MRPRQPPFGVIKRRVTRRSTWEKRSTGLLLRI